MKRASALLALLLALCIMVTAWAEVDEIPIELTEDEAQAVLNVPDASDLALEIGDGIDLKAPEDLSPAALSLSGDLILEDAAQSGPDAAPTDGAPLANATPEKDFTITDSGAVTYIGPGGDVDIPAKVNGTIVTAVASYAFNNEGGKYVTSVKLPGTVTSIGASAFSNCVHLVQIEGTSALTEIGSGAFSGCSKLVGISLPKTLTAIGSSAFSGCSTLEEISLPDGIVDLPGSVFSGCSTLSSVKLPSALLSLGSNAFYNCVNLESIELPGRLESIGTYCFSGTGLTAITLPKGVTDIPSYAFSNCANLTSIQWGAIERIGDNAFTGCANLSVMKLPYESVVDIGQYAFSGCASLTDVTIPRAIVAIKDYSFSGCTLLNRVVMAEGITSIGTGAFQNCTNLSVFDIPAAVRSIGAYAFMNTSLTHAEISKEVRTIDTSTFQNCAKLSKVTIAGGVNGSIVNVRDNAFAGCSSLESIVLPDSVVSLGANAFSGCEKLTSARLPKGMSEFTEIRASTFNGCKKLTSISIPIFVQTIADNAFNGCESLGAVKWEGKNRLKNIGNSAFNGCASLASIDIPSSTVVIGSSAFSGCASLRSVTIPKGVTNLEASAFSGCASLASAKLLLSITELKSGLFQGCASLTSIDIPGNVETIASSAFSGCTSLNTVAWGRNVSVKTIGASAFYGCTALENISIPETVEFIDNSAFYGSPVVVRAECGTYGASWAVRVNISRDIYKHKKVVKDPAKPATTTQTGLTEGKHCEKCGEVIVAQEVIPVLSPTATPTPGTTATPAPGTTVTPAPTSTDIPIGDPEKISLNRKGTVTLSKGNALTLKVTFTPSYTSSILSWKSSDPNVATVSNSGKVRAIAPGTAKITVTTANGKKASVKIKVPEVPATRVTITAPAKALKVGRTLQLKAKLTPSDSTDTVTWKSSNAKVARVSNTGKVTGVKPGSVTVTATASGGKKASVKLKVQRIPATRVTITAPAKTLKVGKTLQLKAKLTPSDSTDKVTWKSSNTKVARVSKTGKVTGIKPGSVTVTATTASGKKASVKLKVQAVHATKVTITAPSKTVKAGKSLQLKATLTPAKAVDKVTWSSSNPKVAKVSKTGKVTGVKPGMAIIIATTSNDLVDSVTITVK